MMGSKAEADPPDIEVKVTIETSFVRTSGVIAIG